MTTTHVATPINDLDGVDDSILPPHMAVPGPGTAGAKAARNRKRMSAACRPKAYTRPEYDALLPVWEFLRQSYEGGEEYLAANLFSHPVEPEPFWQRRLERAVSVNHLRVIVDTYAAQIYKRPVSRNLPEGSTLAEFWADPADNGSDGDKWLEAALKRAYKYGAEAIVVDRRQPESQPESRADERALGVRPYAYTVDPQDVIDWDEDAKGGYRWVAIREYAVGQEPREPGQPYRKPTEQIRFWFADRWELYEVVDLREEQQAEGSNPDLLPAETEEEEAKRYEYRLVDSGAHPVGRVPIVFLQIGERKGSSPFCESPVLQVAYLVRRLTNLLSLIDEQIFHYVFSLLVLDEATADAIEGEAFAPQGFIGVSSDAPFPPFYLAPGVDQIAAIRAEIKETESAIRFVSGLSRSGESSKEARSGLALEFENVDKRALINALGQTMGAAEFEISEIAAAWMEERPPEDYAAPPYEIELLPDEVDQELTRSLTFAGLVAGMGVDLSEAVIENALQAARARLVNSVSPERLAEVIDDFRAKLATAKPRPVPPFGLVDPREPDEQEPDDGDDAD